jgi:hypothetical protein
MRRILTLAWALIIVCGCTGMREQPDHVDPFEYMYPSEVEWDKPDRVLKAFYGAKKRGDWKKAFEICDFNEVLPRKEAKRIRGEWKADSANWEKRYKYRNYYVAVKEQTGTTTLLSVTELYPDRNAKEGVGRADYEETMKLYGKRWKLTVPVVPGQPRTE